MALPTLTEISTSHGFTAGDIDTSGYVAMIPAYQKVYFSDGRIQTDGGYHKLDMVNTKIVASANPNWTTGTIVTQSDATPTVLTKGIVDETISVGGGVYWIMIYRTETTEFVDNLDIVPASGTTLTAAQVTGVVAPPHWLTWTEKTGLTGLPSGGANIGCLYNGRIVLNDLLHPNQWYMSRQGDPLDWLNMADDSGSPVSSQNSKAGLVGDAITCFIPVQDAYLIIGCASSVWLMRGDPGRGGTLALITNETGIFNPTSFCFDDEATLYFVGNDGIYKLTYGSMVNSNPPENLTNRKYPKMIKDLALNRRTDRVAMGYDKTRDGILLSISSRDGQWNPSFWIDRLTGGIFPERYSADSYISSIAYYDSLEADKRGLLCGGYDGYIRVHDEDYKGDEATASTEGTQDLDAIESHLVIGAVDISKKDRSAGKLQELSLCLGDDSDGLDYKVYAKDNPESVVKSIIDGDNTHAYGTITGGGLALPIKQKISGKAMAIKLSNTNDNESFSVEKVDITLNY